MDDDLKPLAWCLACEAIVFGDEDGSIRDDLENNDWQCAQCGEHMTPVRRLSHGSRVQLNALIWFRNLRKKGLQGISPGGASAKLGCHRTMIDKLADMGVLEKSVYNQDGILMVFISERSIKGAMASKQRTGKWTKFLADGTSGEANS